MDAIQKPTISGVPSEKSGYSDDATPVIPTRTTAEYQSQGFVRINK